MEQITEEKNVAAIVSFLRIMFPVDTSFLIFGACVSQLQVLIGLCAVDESKHMV